MSRVAQIQVAFSSGEISPLLRTRIEYQRYQTGLAECRGYLPLRQGGFTRAPGTLFRGWTRDNAPARLIGFQFAVNDALQLEFTDGFMRVWRYGALVMVGPYPYELATPYTEADLPSLQWVQSADVIYLAGGGKPIQRLARLALDNWTIGAAPFKTGPFRVQNLDEAKTLQASATTGTITLTAAPALFTAAYVGSLMRIEAQDYSDIPLWSGNTAVSVGQLMRYGGNIYELTTGTNTGVNAPQHEEGIEQVNIDPVTKWKYVGNGVGIVQITAVASGTSATATVVKTLPQSVVSATSYRWAEGAWSDVHGYPAVLEIHEQRMAVAASPTDPRTIWFSTIGDYQDFEPGIEADSSFAYSIAGSESQNRIFWLKSGATGLHIGAMGEEYSSRSSDGGKAIGPTTSMFIRGSTHGAREHLRPIAPDGRPLFISRDGKRLIEIAYDFQTDANQARELSLPSEHLGANGFEEIAWQSSPLRLAWLRRGTGELAVMLYDPSEEVLGWAPYSLAGGQVQSMAVTADAAGRDDVLTMVVAREIDGATVYMIEEMAQNYGVQSGSQPIRQAIHLFATVEMISADTLTIWPVPHLAGEQVHAWTEVGEFGPLIVTAAGFVTLPYPAREVKVGLFDTTHRATTLPLQPIARDGSAIARRKRLSPPCGIGLHRTAAALAAVVESDFGQTPRSWPSVNLVPRAVAADLTTAWSGIVRAPLTSGYADDLAITFTPVGGAPMTVTAVVPVISEAGI